VVHGEMASATLATGSAHTPARAATIIVT
jgi:hypothetical protein